MKDIAVWPTDVLDKFIAMYRGYFQRIYAKYAPDQAFKVERLFTKYADTPKQFPVLYGKLLIKYKVHPQDVEQTVTLEEMEYTTGLIDGFFRECKLVKNEDLQLPP